MADFNVRSTNLNEIENHDDFRIVWFSSDHHFLSELAKFEGDVDMYSSFKTCDEFIRSFRSERKIFLVLTTWQDYLSYFEKLSQIQSIYVLVTSSKEVHYESSTCSKLINFFYDQSTLIERLHRDILLTYRNDFPMTISCLDEIRIEQSLMSLDQNSNMLLWNQAFTYYLVDGSNVDMDKLKQDMLQQCRLEYKNNPIQLKNIAEFDRDCTYDTVLKWYSKDIFAYRLLNKAFRKRNIDLICKFRYFIILLYNSLKDLMLKDKNATLRTVYRGQSLGENDLKNLRSNIGRLISINTMMSTTRDPIISRTFIFGAQIGILFHINIPIATLEKQNILHPFADISQYSAMSEEEEVLFFAGTVFRINSVEQESDSVWIVTLTLIDETIEQREQFLSGIREQIHSLGSWNTLEMKIHDLILFGKYYTILTGKSLSWKDAMTENFGINMYHLSTILGDHEMLTEFYKNLLWDDKFIDQHKTIILQILIGYNYHQLNKYDDALFHYEIAWESEKDNKKLQSRILTHIGDVFRTTNDFEKALSSYKQALEISYDDDTDRRQIAIICRKICDIYLKQKLYNDALIYQEQGDQIDEQYRQRSELDIEVSLLFFQNQLTNEQTLSPLDRADRLYSIGLCLVKKNDYAQGLEMLMQAKVLLENNASLCDSFADRFVTLYGSIAFAYLMLKDVFNALIYLKKFIDIRSNCDRKT